MNTSSESRFLDVWNAVCTTDPRYTKSFTRGGGFSGTAINHTYLVREATKLWGPIGHLWRVEIVQQGLMPGAPLIVDETGPDGVVSPKAVGNEQIHFVHIRLHYPVFGTNDNGDKVHVGTGTVEHFGQTTFVGMNKRGFFTDEEAPKKSLTDAIGKALSMLGFCADVYLGLFDDNKYVNDRKAAAEKETGAVQAKVTPKLDVKQIEEIKRTLADCESIESLKAEYEKLDATVKPIVKEFVAALAKGLKEPA